MKRQDEVRSLNFTGKYMLAKKEVVNPKINDLAHRVILCQSGFDCSPNCQGTKIFGSYAEGMKQDKIVWKIAEEPFQKVLVCNTDRPTKISLEKFLGFLEKLGWEFFVVKPGLAYERR